MGSENRDYFSDDQYGSGGSFRSAGPMGIIAKIIIATTVCFVATTVAEPLGELLRVSRDGVFSGKIWQLITYGFSAPPRAAQSGGTILFFALAMYILYWVGNMVLPLIGKAEFIWLYISSILVGGLAWIGFPTNPGGVGIDGTRIGMEAMFIWAAMRYPYHEIRLFGIIPLQFWILAAITVLLEVWPSVISAGGGVLTASPMLAAIAFAASHQYFGWRFTALRESLARLKPKPKLRVYSPDDKAASKEEELSSKVDEILAKISRDGEESLTSKERKLLKQASKKYKDRV